MFCFTQIDQLTLVVNCVGFLNTSVAITCILTNKYIERSLRGILLSFSIANGVGSTMFAYDVFTSACGENQHEYDYIVIITVVLSLSHLLLLLLHYYIVLTSRYVCSLVVRSPLGLWEGGDCEPRSVDRRALWGNNNRPALYTFSNA